MSNQKTESEIYKELYPPHSEDSSTSDILRDAIIEERLKFLEFRAAMEWEMGSEWVDRQLEYYKKSVIKTEV